MVELTHGGTWLKWSSLTPRDRSWALLSFVTAGLAALPISIAWGDWVYGLGFRLGSGGLEPPTTGAAEMLTSSWFAYAMLGSLLLAVISAVAWWRFSRNQDEMFNRIQNYAIAQASSWTFAFVVLWWLLWLGGWVEPLSLTVITVIGMTLHIAFWFGAVRKWL